MVKPQSIVRAAPTLPLRSDAVDHGRHTPTRPPRQETHLRYLWQVRINAAARAAASLTAAY